MPHDQQTVSNFPSAANSTTLAIGGIHEVVKQRTSSLSGVPQVPVQPTTGRTCTGSGTYTVGSLRWREISAWSCARGVGVRDYTSEF